MSPPRRLGDVQGQVAHPLDVAGGVDRGDDHPQVGRHGSLQGEQRERLVLGGRAHVVDPEVLGDHLLGQLQVRLQQRSGRALHGARHVLAHARERLGQVVKLLLVEVPHTSSLRNCGTASIG